MKVLQLLKTMGIRWMKILTILVLCISTMQFPSAAVHAAGEPVDAQIYTGSFMVVNVVCDFVDHTGRHYTGYHDREDIIYDSYTGNRMFCVEPGPIMSTGIHYPAGTLQSHFGQTKGDMIQLISYYGTVSGSDIDYFAAQCLIWEIGRGASITQEGTNAAQINAAKAVILSRVNSYFASGKKIRGTSQIYRSTGQDIMTVGTVIMEKEIDVSLQKTSASVSISQNDPSYSLKGAVYHVYEGAGTAGRKICELTSDENGYASCENVIVNEDVSQVTFVEVQSPPGYAKDDQPITVTLSSDLKAHANISEQPLTKRIQVSLNKESSDPSLTDQHPLYDLSGAVFEAYYQLSNGEKHVLGQLVTDANGYCEAEYDHLPLGVNEIYVRELVSPKGYYRDDSLYRQDVVDGKASFRITDVPAMAPFDLIIEKQSADPLNNPAPLDGAQFTLRYYAVEPGTSLSGVSPQRTWIIETKDVNGTYTATLDPSFLVDGDALYTDENGKVFVPLGVLTVQETKAPQGYTLSHVVYNGENHVISEENGVLEIAVRMDSDHSASLVASSRYIYEENRAEGGLAIRKSDTQTGNLPQGNAPNLSAVYRIINLNAYDCAMKINGNIVSIASSNQPFATQIVTDENGNWQSGVNAHGRMDFLQTGKYRIEEIQAPEGYLVSSDNPSYVTGMDFEITSDQQTVLLLDYLGDEIIRGGFSVQKKDEETGRPQGDCDLSTVFTLYNRSTGAVMVNGKMVEVNGVVDVDGDGDAYFVTDSNGFYQSDDQLLPYGSYQLVEVQAPHGYHRNENAQVSFSITSDRMMADLTNVIKDRVTTGKITIYKHYNADPSSEWDDHPEKDAIFLAINRNLLEKYFHDDVFEAYNALKQGNHPHLSGHEFSIITTDAYGLGTSNDLAYGTYVIAQIKGDPDTDLIQERFIFTVNGSSETIQDIHGMDVTVFHDQKPQIICATNDELTYQLIIVKKDAQTGKTVVLNGASFMIGYDCDQDGKWTSQDRNYRSPFYQGTAIRNGYVTQRVAMHDYDVFRTYTGHNEEISKGTFVVDAGNGTNEDYGKAITPLQIRKGNYFLFEMDHDDTSFKETPAGYVQAGKETVEVNGSMFTPLNIVQGSAYEIIYDENTGFSDAERTYTVTKDVYNHRALGKLTLNKSILNTIHDTSLIDMHDFSVFGFELIAYRDIIDPSDGSVIVRAGRNAKIIQDGDYVSTGVMYPDRNGELVVENIPLGEYVCRETVVPAGIVNSGWNKLITFEQKEDDRSTQTFLHHANVINRPTRVEFSKISSEDGSFLEGATLRVVNRQGEVMDEWISASKPHVITGLTAGEIYVLQEERAPDGYVVSSPIPFTVKNTIAVQKIKMVDKTVSVLKQDVTCKGIEGAHLVVVDESGNTIDAWISDGSLHQIQGLQEGQTYILKETQAPDGYVYAQDIVFTVKADGKSQVEVMVDQQVFFHKTDSDGNPLSKAVMCVKTLEGEIVDEWITDGNPHAIFGLTVSKSYIITEISAPQGYVKAVDILFTVEDNNRNQNVTMTDYQVCIEKTDENGKSISGASLEIIDENNVVVDKWISDGNVHQASGLSAGHIYTLHEKQNPSGYYMSEDVMIDLENMTADKEVVMVDETVRVQIEKVDEDGNPVDDVYLQLFDLDRQIQIALPQDGKTGEAPIELIGRLEAGHRYRLNEIQWKEGFHQAASLEFSIPLYGNSQPLVISMLDESVAISVIKQDDAGKPLAGAKLQIVEASINEEGEYEAVMDENGEKIVAAEITTEEKPTDVSQYLRGGQPYIICESLAPDGYETSSDTWFIASGKTDCPQTIVVVDTRKKYTLEVIKRDDENDALLAGAQFGLYDQDGVIVTDTSGNPCITNTDETGKALFEVFFDPSGYTLREISAPKGYLAEAENIQIDLLEESDEDGVIRLVIPNERIPDTSDPHALGLMLMLFGGSFLIIGVILYMNSDHFGH